MRSILAALDSSTISRLTKTWSSLSSKYKILLDAMRRLADHAKNYGAYREALRETKPPAVPFLGKGSSFSRFLWGPDNFLQAFISPT